MCKKMMISLSMNMNNDNTQYPTVLYRDMD